MKPQQYYSTTGAAQRIAELRQAPFPPNTLAVMELRGAIGPFARDSAGRRVLVEEDIQTILRYLEGRRRAQGPDSDEPDVPTIDPAGDAGEWLE